MNTFPEIVYFSFYKNELISIQFLFKTDFSVQNDAFKNEKIH